MKVQAALKSQYHAAIKTLRLVVEACPDELWNDPADGQTPFWRVAYHTLFYAHFYLQQDQGDFKPWEKHQNEAQDFKRSPAESGRAPAACVAYTRPEVLAYLGICDRMIDAGVDALDLSAERCGFPWYPMGTLEHQIVNIRHIQHHAAMLSSRLRRAGVAEVDWVGMGVVQATD